MFHIQQQQLNLMAKSNHYCKVKSSSREREAVSSKTLDTTEVLNELFVGFGEIFSNNEPQKTNTNESKNF